MTTQQNTYKIFFSNGKPSEIYITASNIKEACILAKPLAKQHQLDNYMVKRCYNGGVMGSWTWQKSHSIRTGLTGWKDSRFFFSPTKPKTMNKIERIFDAVMHAVTLLAIAGGFYWIFIRFLITYLKTL